MKKLCLLFSFSFLFGGGEYVDNNRDRNLSYVVINYQDEMGNAIEDSVVLEGEVSSEYDNYYYDIKGYVLKEILGNKSGIFLENDSYITYVYSPLVPVTGSGYGSGGFLFFCTLCLAVLLLIKCVCIIYKIII